MDTIRPLRTSSYVALGAALFWGCKWRLLPSVGVAAAVGLVVERMLMRKQKESFLPEPEPSTYSDWVMIEGERLPPCEPLDESFVIIELETTAKLVRDKAGTEKPCFMHNGEKILALTEKRWVNIGSHLGRGATKNVYSARQHGAGIEEVAVGFVNHANEQAIKQEEAIRRKLPSSPFLAELFEVFDLEPYIVTVAPRHSPKPLRPQSAHYLLTGFVHVAKGLEIIHNVPLVHTDIKPQNILWSPEGARLADFDLIREEGDVVGNRVTPLFVPPEYGREVRAGRVHRPGDIWSLGLALQQVMFGKGGKLSAPVDQMRRPTIDEVEQVMRGIIRNGQEPFHRGLGSTPHIPMSDELLRSIVALRNGMLLLEASQRPAVNVVATQLERITKA